MSHPEKSSSKSSSKSKKSKKYDSDASPDTSKQSVSIPGIKSKIFLQTQKNTQKSDVQSFGSRASEKIDNSPKLAGSSSSDDEYASPQVSKKSSAMTLTPIYETNTLSTQLSADNNNNNNNNKQADDTMEIPSSKKRNLPDSSLIPPPATTKKIKGSLGQPGPLPSQTN
jgi:hypothetical protein